MKKLIVFFISLFFSGFFIAANCQVLHLGVRVNSTPFQFLSNQNEREFYYNNSANENFSLKALKNNQLETIQYENADFIDLPPFILPTFYVRYDFKNDFFLESELFFTYHHNEIATDKPGELPVVDYGQENTEFRNENIKLDFYFLSNGFHLGYKPIRTRKLKPYFLAGVNFLYLMDFVTEGAIENKELKESHSYYYRAKPVLEHINNFSRVNVMASAGLGFEYRAFNVKVTGETNISPIDFGETPYYKRFYQVTVGIGYHFLSFNLISNKNKQVIKRNLKQ